MAEIRDGVLDIDECVSKIFKKREIATVENVCAMSSYSEEELRNAVIDFYNEFYSNSRRPVCPDLLCYYIEDKWFWRLLYAYRYYKHVGNDERIVDFLTQYNLTTEFVDALITRHPIQSGEFYFFRAALVDYYGRKEDDEIENQNEKLRTAFNLDVRCTMDDLTNKINCIKISNRFIRRETLKSLGIQCIEVEIAKEKYPERLSNKLENVDAERLKNIGEDGIVKIGSYVRGGDIIVAKGKLSNLPIRKEIDSSVFLPQTLEGKVVDVQVKSQAKGDLLKGKTNLLIRVYIDVQLPIQKGDMLMDKSGKCGIVIGTADDENVDMIANFNFDGRVVKRLDSPKEPHILHARGGINAQYSDFDDTPLENGLNAPVVLTKALVKKFVRNDFFSVLQDVLFVTDVNAVNRAKAIRILTPKMYNICNRNAIVKFVEIGKAVGFDVNIYSPDNGELKYEDVINAPDLKVDITPMTNDKIDKTSKGQIENENSLNWNRWRIFGRTEAEMRQFMGHIELPISYCNPIFPQIQLSKILVYPVRYRWIKPRKSGSIVANWSQEVYASIIQRRNRIVHLTEYGTIDIVLQNEKRGLLEQVDDYYVKGCAIRRNIYSGLLSDYFGRLKDFFAASSIDYCATMRTIAATDTQEGVCLLPWNIIRIIFQDKMLTWLSYDFQIIDKMEGIITELTAEEILLRAIFGEKWEIDEYEDVGTFKLNRPKIRFKESKEQDDELLMEKVNQFLLNENVYVTAKDDEGKILKLVPQAILDEDNEAAMVLNPVDYEKLAIKEGTPVVVIYDPIDCGKKQKINDRDKQEFYDFIDALTNDKIKKRDLPNLFSRCINEINSKNIANSLAFCMLTGRRLFGSAES